MSEKVEGCLANAIASSGVDTPIRLARVRIRGNLRRIFAHLRQHIYFLRARKIQVSRGTSIYCIIFSIARYKIKQQLYELDLYLVVRNGHVNRRCPSTIEPQARGACGFPNSDHIFTMSMIPDPFSTSYIGHHIIGNRAQHNSSGDFTIGLANRPSVPDDGDDEEDADDELEVDQLAQDEGETAFQSFYAPMSAYQQPLADGSLRRQRGRGYTIRDEVNNTRPSGSSIGRDTLTTGSVTESDDEVDVQPLAKRAKTAVKEEDLSSVTESDSGPEVLMMTDRRDERKPTRTPEPPAPISESISEFTCPVCFSPPTFATATLCGHVMCGECLFSAVRAQIQQNPYGPERNVAR